MQTDLESELKGQDWNGRILIMMSSGNFGGLDLNKLASQLLNKA